MHLNIKWGKERSVISLYISNKYSNQTRASFEVADPTTTPLIVLKHWAAEFSHLPVESIKVCALSFLSCQHTYF